MSDSINDQSLRADAGDPNRDRADLVDQAPAQADDEAIEHNVEQIDADTDHDAPTVAE